MNKTAVKNGTDRYDSDIVSKDGHLQVAAAEVYLVKPSIKTPFIDKIVGYRLASYF